MRIESTIRDVVAFRVMERRPTSPPGARVLQTKIEAVSWRFHSRAAAEAFMRVVRMQYPAGDFFVEEVTANRKARATRDLFNE